MSRKTATSASRCRHYLRSRRQQMDLFKTDLAGAPGAPLWPDLPEEARSVLTGLMTQLILNHAAEAATPPSKEDGHDQ
jgi:hypothetical protein